MIKLGDDMIKLFIDVEYDEYYVMIACGAYMLLEDWQGDGGPVYLLKDEDRISTLHFVSDYTRAQLAAM